MARTQVLIGFLGATLDQWRGPERWERWRPTVAVCRHEDLLVDRFELLYQKKFAALCRSVIEDIATVSPETVVNPIELSLEDAWDFQEVYGALHEVARTYSFKPEREEYLVHITTGTHVAQICMFLLTESRYF